MPCTSDIVVDVAVGGCAEFILIRDAGSIIGKAVGF
jgi:hypothetical protein